MGVWFPAWSRGGTLYFKSVGGLLRLHYDDGLHVWDEKTGKTINPFFNIQSNKELKNIVMKVGANILSTGWNVGARARYALNEDVGQLSLATRQEWIRGPWTVAGCNSFNLNSLTLLSNALKIGFQKGNNDFFLTAEQKDNR